MRQANLGDPLQFPWDQITAAIHEYAMARAEALQAGKSAGNVASGHFSKSDILQAWGWILAYQVELPMYSLTEQEFAIASLGFSGAFQGQAPRRGSNHAHLADGTEFANNRSAPHPGEIDLSMAFPGLAIGLQQIEEGGRIRLFLPPDLAYGDEPPNGIPPGSVVIVEVDLESVIPAL